MNLDGNSSKNLMNMQELYNSQHHHQEYNYQKVDSFDPNLGNVGEYRYSPPYCQTSENSLNSCPSASTSNVTMIQNYGSFSGHENGLLSVAEAAQTIESGLLDQYNILPSEHHIITTFIRSITETDQSYKVPINRGVAERQNEASVPEGYQHYSDDGGSGFVHQENLTDATGTTHLIFRRSPNGTSYQQIPDYVLRNEELQNTNSLNGQSVALVSNSQHDHQTSIQSDVYEQYENSGTIGLIFSNELPYDDNNRNLLIDGTTACHQIIDPNEKRLEPGEGQTNVIVTEQTMGHVDKDQLLEMTISPLLAAISNITDKESRYWTGDNQSVSRQNLNYYNVEPNVESVVVSQGEQIDDEVVPSRNDSMTNASLSLSDEYIDINDVKTIELINKDKDDDEWFDDGDNNKLRRSKRKTGGVKTTYLMVTDKHVPCRAWASLPTFYLTIGRLYKSTLDAIQYTIYSKKEILLCTKFGPYEGDLIEIHETDLMNMKNENPKTYPILLVGPNQMLDTSNENTSNWMRFVRLATTFTQQNLLLFEENNKLYFKSSQIIRIKEELRVGYSFEYASKYNLPFLKEIINTDIDVNQTGLTPNRFKKRRGKMHHCPVCVKSFFKIDSLKRHVNIHSGNPSIDQFLNELEASLRVRRTRKSKSQKSRKSKHLGRHQFKCTTCVKVFQNAERLKKHLMVHNPNTTKPFKCDYCVKRFLNASAKIAHVKTHIVGRQHYTCLVCDSRFTQIVEFSRHIKTHSENGVYPCLYCDKKFQQYILMRKHVLTLHRPKRFRCEVCDKLFYTSSKLRLHMLRHSKKKEFLCSVCGRQYKRKDKLTEHLKSHEKKVNVVALAANETPTEIPATSTNDDYQRFIYKCHECVLGFKRRGMLVNHLAKRHPEIRIDSVPELNLPILQEQKFFYCQYCPKVYRTNAKRKLHILKYHPGKELPSGARQKHTTIDNDMSSTFTETVATITTEPHLCDWCHRQYASRTKLATHKRKKHPEKMSDQITDTCDGDNDGNNENVANRRQRLENELSDGQTMIDSEHNGSGSSDYSEKYNPNGMDYEINSISHFGGEAYHRQDDHQFLEHHGETEILVETIETSEISNLMDEIDYMNPCPVAIVTNAIDCTSSELIETIDASGSSTMTSSSDFKDLKTHRGRRKRNF